MEIGYRIVDHRGYTFKARHLIFHYYFEHPEKPYNTISLDLTRKGGKRVRHERLLMGSSEIRCQILPFRVTKIDGYIKMEREKVRDIIKKVNSETIRKLLGRTINEDTYRGE